MGVTTRKLPKLSAKIMLLAVLAMATLTNAASDPNEEQNENVTTHSGVGMSSGYQAPYDDHFKANAVVARNAAAENLRRKNVGMTSEEKLVAHDVQAFFAMTSEEKRDARVRTLYRVRMNKANASDAEPETST